MGRLARLRREGHTAATIAQQLTEEGFRTPQGRGAFTKELVRQLLSRRGLGHEKTQADQLRPQEWWLADLGRELGMPALKLRDWIWRGWLHGRQTPAQGLWIAWADRDEVRRLRKLKALSKRGIVAYPKELTTPKKRKEK